MGGKKQKKPKKKQNKIITYRKPWNLNIGMIIFAIIFIYMIFSVSIYMQREKIQVYEVVEGSIVNEKKHTGMILREETAYYTEYSGYLNYYVREGKRASVGTNIYSVDEKGSIAAFMKDHPEASTSLTESDFKVLKKELSSFSTTYQDDDFQTVYDVKYSLEALVMEYLNFNALDNLNLMNEAGVKFQQIKATQAGVVSYAIDSYEDLELSAVSAELFSKADYERNIPNSNKEIAINSPAYKLVTSDLWSVVFLLTKEEAAQYSDSASFKIVFEGKDLSLTGDFSMFTGADGNVFGKLDFNKYMVQFLSERFVNFEIVAQKTTGLKIPISAATNKQFHLVPVDFLAQGGDGSAAAAGFMKEVYSEQGTSIVFVPATIYYSDEEYYYIDLNEIEQLNPGDYLIKPDHNSQRHQLGATDTLLGVYNINKGYAVFKQIEVLSSNAEYYIIKKGMDYGLSVYDHIALDASAVEEGKFIYQ